MRIRDRLKPLFLVAISSILSRTAAPALHAGDPAHPPVYADKGACPGEGCTYGAWKVLKETPLRALPDERTKVVATCRAGSIVSALTGEVHTDAGRFSVKKTHAPFVPGDVLWVYTYLGEGQFKVWFGGRFMDQNLGFSPWGGSAGTRCEVERHCWGELDRDLNMVWWIQIRNADGVTGWTRESGNFDSGGM